jgi:hypothetical protein
MLVGALGDRTSLTFGCSSFTETFFIEVLLGWDPRLSVSSENLLEILVSIKVALSLLIGNSWSAELVASLVDTPLLIVLGGKIKWFGIIVETSQVWVSIDVASGLSISQCVITSLYSLLLLAMMLPVDLSLVKVTQRVDLNHIWVPIEVALSLCIGHVGCSDDSLLLR